MTVAPRDRAPYALASVVILAVLVVASAMLTLDRTVRPVAAAGHVYSAPAHLTKSKGSWLLVPWGRVDLGVTTPRLHLPSGVGPSGIRPPADGSFVGVRWQADGNRLLPLPRTSSGKIKPTRITVVADGRRYPLHRGPDPVGAGIDLGEHQAWVAVRGRPAEVTLEVSYDGVAQSLDPRTGRRVTGRATSLYSVPAAVLERPCGPPNWSSGYTASGAAAQCRIDYVARFPYVGGLGWAASGRAWLAVTVATLPPGGLIRQGDSGPATEYGIDAGATRVAYDYADTPPSSVRRIDALGGRPSTDAAAQVIFGVPGQTDPTAEFTVTASYTGTARESATVQSPDQPVVDVSWDVLLG